MDPNGTGKRLSDWPGLDMLGHQGGDPAFGARLRTGLMIHTQKDVRAGKVHDNSPMSVPCGPRGVSRTRDGTLTVGSIHGTINCAAGFGAPRWVELHMYLDGSDVLMADDRHSTIHAMAN
jgi:hypothetical protein